MVIIVYYFSDNKILIGGKEMTLKTTSNKVFPLILPLLASIPTFIFIFNLIFPSLEIFKVPRLFPEK